jgi:hypothetical protein
MTSTPGHPVWREWETGRQKRSSSTSMGQCYSFGVFVDVIISAFCRCLSFGVFFDAIFSAFCRCFSFGVFCRFYSFGQCEADENFQILRLYISLHSKYWKCHIIISHFFILKCNKKVNKCDRIHTYLRSRQNSK